MKLKKFIKPLVTVSALSMLLMGCAEDSSNSGGSTTPPTAESVFSNFLAGFQSAPAKNATALEFTTNAATKQTLKVAQGEEVQYLVSLDDVMGVYYAMFGITGSSTLLTPAGSDITLSDSTKIKNYAKVNTNAEASIELALTNGTNSLYTGMFALMSQENVKALDTALGELDNEIKTATPTEGEVTTPDLTKIQAATVQKVVDLINGNMYKVAYNSPAQSVQTAFAAAQPLTLKNGMAFTEGDGGSTFEIAAGKLSYEGANPAIDNTKVVVFLDEFKNKLNGVTASSEDTVKSEGTLTNNNSLGITTDTVSSSVSTKKITYTPATEVVAGAKVTYIAILDNTDAIDSSTEGDAFKVLNGKITTGATKAEVEAALALLNGKIYKVDYTVDTKLELVNNFKQAVADAVANPDGATLQVTKLALTKGTNYEDTTTTIAQNDVVYCFDGLFAGVDTAYTKYLQLNAVNGGTNASDVSSNTGAYKATAGDPSSSQKIDFTAVGTPQATDVIKAYCKSYDSTESQASGALETAITTYNNTKNYTNLKAVLDALTGTVIYGEVTVE